MHQMDYSSIRRWVKVNQKHHAATISVFCPHCSELGNVRFDSPKYDQLRDAHSATGRCPSCDKRVHAWTLNASSPDNSNSLVFVYPSPATKRPMIQGLESIPKEIANEYSHSIQLYNDARWTEVGFRARRTLEAVVSKLLSENEKSGILARDLSKLSDHPDLRKPITELSDALRMGGNFSAHFQGATAPTKETAEAMVALVESMLEYLFIVPSRTEELSRHIEKLQKCEGKE